MDIDSLAGSDGASVKGAWMVSCCFSSEWLLRVEAHQASGQ
jgi:hypothetical protein